MCRYRYQYFYIAMYHISTLGSDVFNDQQAPVLNNDSSSYLIPSTPQLVKQNKKWQLDLRREKQTARETLMNGFEMDESHEGFVQSDLTVEAIRSDSLMDISNHYNANQLNEIQTTQANIERS